MDQTDFLIIGAGVVGLAIASEISKRFQKNTVTLLEKHPKFGQETSSRNSEVIHSGVYYPDNSLKTRLCIEGRQKLIEHCERKFIPYKCTGKLVVATNETETDYLEKLLKHSH